jgi:hypothetical protein
MNGYLTIKVPRILKLQPLGQKLHFLDFPKLLLDPGHGLVPEQAGMEEDTVGLDKTPQGGLGEATALKPSIPIHE